MEGIDAVTPGWTPLVQRSASLPFRPVLCAPHDVRIFVSDTVRGWGFGDLAESAELLVSELVTNVVRHAHTDGVARVEALPAGIRVTVADHDPRSPQPRTPAPSSPDGRGLGIVATLARRWGVDRVDAENKAVWFELDDDVYDEVDAVQETLDAP